MDKDVAYICIYTMEYYSAMRKKDILPIVTTCMNLEVIKLSKISQTSKTKRGGVE